MFQCGATWGILMTFRMLSLPVRTGAVAAGAAIMIAAAAVLGGSAFAQQPPPAPAKPAPARPAAKPAAPPAAQPAQPAPQAPPAAAQQAAPEMPPLIYTPWVKVCGKGQDPNAKEVCFTGKDARTEAGQPVVAAALIEPEGEPKKLFRITLPSPLQLQYGTRIIIDQQPAISSPFFTCFANGCMADYEATPDFISKLKKGQVIAIQAINLAAAAISFPLPLNDFAKANEGPPTDPKVAQAQQEKLQADLQKKADDMRKKLESSGGATPPK
jgi:invasion protein IalB